jgi:hypothetical protein
MLDHFRQRQAPIIVRGGANRAQVWLADFRWLCTPPTEFNSNCLSLRFETAELLPIGRAYFRWRHSGWTEFEGTGRTIRISRPAFDMMHHVGFHVPRHLGSFSALCPVRADSPAVKRKSLVPVASMISRSRKLKSLLNPDYGGEHHSEP